MTHVSTTRRRLLGIAGACAAAPWLGACAGPASLATWAEEPRPAEPAPAPWALALSGGGLRGLAHVGVLRALRALGVEPPLVVGSSIGAVIGALYAAGAPPESMESLALAPELEPWDVFTSPAARSAALAALLGHALGRARIEDFARRFAAVATDRDSGEARAFGRGDAVTAVLASAALPGALAPQFIGRHEYVDGGLSQPLPVRLARAMGAARVVAVDVCFHPEVPPPAGRLDSVFHAGMLMVRNLASPDRAVADVLIEPVLPPVPEVTLQRRAALIECGERAAMALAARLHELSGAPCSSCVDEARRGDVPGRL